MIERKRIDTSDYELLTELQCLVIEHTTLTTQMWASIRNQCIWLSDMKEWVGGGEDENCLGYYLIERTFELKKYGSRD